MKSWIMLALSLGLLVYSIGYERGWQVERIQYLAQKELFDKEEALFQEAMTQAINCQQMLERASCDLK